MKKHIFSIAVAFIVLLVLQVCLFNRIHLFGVACPLVYVYFPIKLPVRTDRNIVLMLCALMGLLLDFMGNTLGLNMLSLVFAGFVRTYILNLFAPRDMAEDCIPSITTFGRNLFLRYAGMLLLVHHTVFFIAEAGEAASVPQLMLRIVGSFLLTFLIVFAVEKINNHTQ
jgi:rod shape-determining protein MreD